MILFNEQKSLPTLASTLNKARDYIVSCQLSDGAIPWFKDGMLDPWDHAEAAMALSVCGNWKESQKALYWLCNNQNNDGSWFAKYYGDTQDQDLNRYKIETNFVAYPATALWHYYLCNQDRDFIQELFPCIEKAINFVLKQQTSEGDIQWALSEKEVLAQDALITANASILRSLECAIELCSIVGREIPEWILAYDNLADCLKSKPWRFDRTWESKARFSMDWFYPVIAGIYSQEEARERLQSRWEEFVHPELGCRCVSDEPWITIAESCELCLALSACGEIEKANTIFKQMLRWQDEDGGFWTGYTFRDKVVWPEEKTTWTAGVVILAADSLFKISKGHSLFTQPSGLLF